jgi:dolichyl-phosphate beta-glucosyltransferase
MPRFWISLIIPAYNEVERISGTIKEAKLYFERLGRTCEIIVVADGTDGTRELVGKLALADPAIKVIGEAQRRGKGYGVRRGVAAAQGEIIGYIDADNKTPIEEFDKFEPLLREGCDVVIGSRTLPDSSAGERPVIRRLGAQGFAWVMHALVGLRDIPDTQCGFKFFSRRVALDLFERQTIDGYIFDVELLHLARQAGYRIAQVPIRWHDDGDSRLALFSGNLRNMVELLRIAFAPAARPSRD